MAALMKLRSIFACARDSIGLGESAPAATLLFPYFGLTAEAICDAAEALTPTP